MQSSACVADAVVEAGKRCSLTKSVLAEWARRGTPRQVEYLLGYLEAEGASRDASKRAQLLRRCALPQAKTFEGYDWSAVSWPPGTGREDLLGLGFVAIPLVPALLALPSANPVRAVGACLLFAPWLAYAYYIDCIRPYTGGGASMVYVLVVMGGLPSSIIGALATGPVMRLLGIEVGGGQRAGTESRG